jgi:hypothetical protein
METLCYTVDFFRNLVFENSANLQPDISDILIELDRTLVIPQELLEAQPLFRVDSNSSNNSNSSNSDRKFRRPYASGGRRANKPSNNTHEHWESVRNFKATKIEKSEGIQIHIGEIRGFLNKLSIKNYDDQSTVIINALSEIIDKNINEDDKLVLLQNVFSILSSNIYLSSIYADLYVELVGTHDLFETFIDEFVEKYKDSFHEIHYVDPNDDYDKFCDYNKINDNRKCNATFIVNLMKRDMISHSCILQLIYQTQEIAMKYIDEENRQNEVEEITENIVLIIMEVKPILIHTDMWKTKIQPCINFFTGLKVKEHSSFTSRAKFKYMDCA